MTATQRVTPHHWTPLKINVGVNCTQSNKKIGKPLETENKIDQSCGRGLQSLLLRLLEL